MVINKVTEIGRTDCKIVKSMGCYAVKYIENVQANYKPKNLEK
jgi:DNA-binding HxlR family transcriptional regulator